MGLRWQLAMTSIGLWVYGLAAIATGVVNLVWGNFEAAHEPIQAFGDHIAGEVIFAYIIAVLLVAGGGAILWRRAARIGATTLVIIYLIFAVFSIPRLYTAPRVLGFRIPVFIGVLDGVGQQLILSAAGATVLASLAKPSSSWQRRLLLLARWIFGLSSIDFGLSHLTGVKESSIYVPQWMPLGGGFWTILTGICFVLAGIAILSGILDVLAGWLLGLMLLVFSALVLAPRLFAFPHDQVAWGSNTYNLAAVGAAWILANCLAGWQHQKRALA